MLQVLTDAAHEPTLAEEADAHGGGELRDMANLRQNRTGVPGVIFISTRMGRHGPRVQWFAERPDASAPGFSVSIAEPPAVVASSVDARLLSRHAEAVGAWVALNRGLLLQFWDAGAGLFEDEREALIARLAPIE